MVVVRRLSAVAVLAVLVAACGGGDDAGGHSDAVAAFERQFDLLSDGQFGRQWDELHPAQQELVARDDYVACMTDQAAGLDITSVDVEETFTESITVPGTAVEADSVAITARVVAKVAGVEDETTDTYHEVEVDGGWRWVTDDPDRLADC